MKKQNKRNIKSNRKKLSAKIKNQTQSDKKIEVRIAETLEEALATSDRNGLTQAVYDGILYVKPMGEWIGIDIIERLLDFPMYQKIKQSLVNEDEMTIKNILLTVWISNRETNSEYDIDVDTLLN